MRRSTRTPRSRSCRRRRRVTSRTCWRGGCRRTSSTGRCWRPATCASRKRARLSRVRAALVLVTALVLAAAPALAATPRPDAHDRALVARLSARISTLKAVAKQTDSKQLDETLKGCPALKGDPSKAFAAVFVLLPALLIDVVNQYKPQLSRLRDELSGMRPHSQLFADWLAREGDSLDLILTFD